MKKKETADEKPKCRPATTPEQREDELINLAVDLAEKQLRDGTASTQVIVHYLKLGSTRGMLEHEMLQHQTELVRAKTEAIQSNKKVEELYKNALEAMRVYSGGDDYDDLQDL
jgi:hypothetical protein